VNPGNKWRMFSALLYLPRLLSGITAAGAVLFFAGGVTAQTTNDIFAQRAQITGTNYLVTYGGNTAGATAVNEVDEKMEPAPQTQASVWFEWKATSSRVWAIKARFSSTGMKGGLAAYVLPENGSQMSQLEPAGACLDHAEPSVGLRVVKDHIRCLEGCHLSLPGEGGKIPLGSRAFDAVSRGRGLALLLLASVLSGMGRYSR
jgi:hypothetical protein